MSRIQPPFATQAADVTEEVGPDGETLTAAIAARFDSGELLEEIRGLATTMPASCAAALIIQSKHIDGLAMECAALRARVLELEQGMDFMDKHATTH